MLFNNRNWEEITCSVQDTSCVFLDRKYSRVFNYANKHNKLGRNNWHLSVKNGNFQSHSWKQIVFRNTRSIFTLPREKNIVLITQEDLERYLEKS